MNFAPNVVNNKRRNPRRRQAAEQPGFPALRFSPAAWAKLLFLRDYGPSEVGGFGITAAEDLLRVDEIRLIRQSCTAVTVRFDDQAVADFFDDEVDQGRSPAQFARVWIHTHPGESARPSETDEETFERCFGGADWAVMFILAAGGDTFARLRISTGPGLAVEIPAQVDYAAPFPAADPAAWEQEYLNNVTVSDRGDVAQSDLPLQQSPAGSLEEWESGPVDPLAEFDDWYRQEALRHSEPFLEESVCPGKGGNDA